MHRCCRSPSIARVCLCIIIVAIIVARVAASSSRRGNAISNESGIDVA